MREVPSVMTSRWYSGMYVGDSKPIARVTLQVPNIRLYRASDNLFSSLMFGGGTTPREVPNVKSVNWNRSTDADVAECTIELYNTDPLPVGVAPTKDLDRPGFYTYNYGGTSYSARWGHKPNQWSGALMPDNIIRTFEGYGHNPSVTPEKDPNLVQTGMWMIDDVDYTSDGHIIVRCRDVGRILLDQIAFPPVVPFRAGFKTRELPHGAYAYPVSFAGRNTDPVINKIPVPAQTSRLGMSFRTNSNAPYVGSGAIHGHRPQHAFNDDDASFWLSVGNARPDQGYSFEWIEGSIKKQTVRRVRFKSRYTGHTAYVSLYVQGKGYAGSRTVPYNPNHPVSAPNGANVKYVAAVPVTSTGWTEVTIPNGIKDVTRVRVCFGGLANSGIGPYPFRAGMRRFEVYGGAGATTRTEKITFRDKNYDDYTDIVKLFCAWGGFYWPKVDGGAQEKLSGGDRRYWSFRKDDKAMTIRSGRVWGDFQLSGTAGPAPIPASVFDKKPLMDGIAYVRDILGYIFHIDEYGSVVFRAPNIYSVGNTMRSLSSVSGERTRRMVTLDERQTLISVTASLSSRSLRERTFVAGASGNVGHMAAGWNPNPIGLRRVGGWTDQHFETSKEARVMAELIALRQLFTFRTDKATIPGYPAIQIDDQVRIFERVTTEGYIHYVTGIQSSLSHETGEYIYELDTHWLGERPFKKWAFDPQKLSNETRSFLAGLHRTGGPGMPVSYSRTP